MFQRGHERVDLGCVEVQHLFDDGAILDFAVEGEALLGV